MESIEQECCESLLLSIIVPVYHVEAYLDQCVSSIISQSYGKIELILVDDGSNDECPRMCDEWAKQDNRIVVIHQVNMGLSGARNSGLDIARGDYITFIDSDDYISQSIFSHCMSLAISTNADIVVYRTRTFNNADTTIDLRKQAQHDVRSFSLGTDEVLKQYLYPQYGIEAIACNKLFSRRVAERLRFENGKLFEDFIPITRSIIEADSIVVTQKEGYYYRKHSESINGNGFHSIVFNPRILDLNYAMEGIIKIVSEYDNTLLDCIIPAAYVSKLSILNQMIVTDSISEDYIFTFINWVRENRETILKCRDISLQHKIRALILLRSRNLYCNTYRLYKRLITLKK